MFLCKDSYHALLVPNSMFLIVLKTVCINPPSAILVLGYQKIVKCSDWVDAIIHFFLQMSRCPVPNVGFGTNLERVRTALHMVILSFGFIQIHFKLFLVNLIKILVNLGWKLWLNHRNYGVIIQIIAQSPKFWQLSWE